MAAHLAAAGMPVVRGTHCWSSATAASPASKLQRRKQQVIASRAPTGTGCNEELPLALKEKLGTITTNTP
jgi:hypothetical protein